MEDWKKSPVRDRLDIALITGQWYNTINDDILLAKEVWLSLEKDTSDNVLAALAWNHYFD